jgi:SAM-dependent methyltransferase
MERLAAWVLEKRGDEVEKQLAEAKRQWIAPIRGRVLELGPGLGTNLPYLTQAQWTGLEPSPIMRAKLQQRGTPGPVIAGSAEGLPFPDASFDVVLTTLVLCSVRDAIKTLAEIRRVLKPNGAFVYIEHVAAATLGTRCVQQLLRPACALIGCHPVRQTGKTIANAGFSAIEQVDFEVKGMSLLPHIAGRAIA